MPSGPISLQRIAPGPRSSWKLAFPTLLATASAAAESPGPVPAPAGSAAGEPIEITVVGTRVGKTAGSAHVIGRKKLERFEYDDPQAVVSKVPGAYGRGEDGMGLRPNLGLRGVNPDRSKKVTLLEDGIPFAPSPYAAPAAYYFPLITRMTGVRVIKGPAAVSYGPHTVAGAIDLVTRPIPAVPSGGADLALGGYAYRKLHGHFGSSDEHTGFLLEGVHLGSDGWKELPSGADTGFVRNEWMLKAYYVPDPLSASRQELRLKLGYSDEISNETYLGLSDADFRDNPRQRYSASALDRMSWHRTSIAVTHFLEPRRGLTVTTTAYRHDLARTWRKANHFAGAELFDVVTSSAAANVPYQRVLRGQADWQQPGETLYVGPNERSFVSQGVETRVRWETRGSGLEHRIEYGVHLHEDRIERRHSENGFLMFGGELFPDGEATRVTAFNEAEGRALALHAADAVSFGALTLTPGVRVEALRTKFVDRAVPNGSAEKSSVGHAVLPGLGAFYALSDTVGVLAGAYRGYSPPAPELGRDTESEFSINYEAGARLSDDPLRAELIGFYNDYDNLTDQCTLSSGCSEGNLDRQFDAGKAAIYGLEAYLDHELPWGPLRLPLGVSYTYTHAEFLNTFSSQDPIFGDVEAGDELPYVPRHQLAVWAGGEYERAGVNLTASYVAAMREQAGDEPLEDVLATDQQFVVDASARYRLLAPLHLYAQLRNVFDSIYLVSRRPYGARPNAPRWIQIGVKAEF